MTTRILLLQHRRAITTMAVILLLVTAGVASPEPYKISVVSLTSSIFLLIDFVNTRVRSTALLMIVFLGLAALAWPRAPQAPAGRPSPTVLHQNDRLTGTGAASQSTDAAIKMRVEEAQARYLAAHRSQASASTP